ncbi:MAG: DEAD/DEAH box helicase [Actinobacteria bacterium]|nr:DEAD/DEAH box helicase [Actinomycetota bacterium]
MCDGCDCSEYSLVNGSHQWPATVDCSQPKNDGLPFSYVSGFGKWPPNTSERTTVSTHASSTLVSPAPTNSQPSFADLGVPDALVERLALDGIITAFPIQAATLPDSLQGRDVLGRGRTGSGKTLAFSLALINSLLESPAPREQYSPRALVLLPTRELAQQVADVIAPLAKAVRMRVASVYGGVGYGPQINALRNGVDIVIACPGRLEDLIENGQCQLDFVQVTVLDEADHMADLGFLPAVKRLLELTPEGGQRLLFSATLDKGVDQIVRKYLQNPITHAVDPNDSDMPIMTHHVFSVTGGEKAEVIRQLVSGEGKTVAFTRTKHGAKNLARRLTESGIPAVELHGNLSQAVRAKNLARFSTGKVRVLVATDIAARGIHVDDVALVLHVDPPEEHKAYVHRSGRTARAGAEGIVVTMATPAQHGSVKSLMKLAGIKPFMRPVKPGDEAITDISGPRAELIHTAYVEEPEPAPRRDRASRSSGQGSARPSSRSGDRSRAPREASRPRRDDARPSSSRPRRDDAAPARRDNFAPSRRDNGAPARRDDRPVRDESRTSSRPARDSRTSSGRPTRSYESGADRTARSYESRDSRPSRGSDDRSSRDSRPARSYESRDARPTRGNDDRPRRDDSRSTSRPSRDDRPRRDDARGTSKRSTGSRSESDRPRSERPTSDRPRSDRPRSDRPRSDRPTSGKTAESRAAKPRARGPKKAPGAGVTPRTKKVHRKGPSSRGAAPAATRGTGTRSR